MRVSSTRLKHVANVVAGQSPPSDAVDELNGGVPFIQGNAEFGEASPAPRFECATAPKTCEPGDVLLSVRAPVGALNVADQIYGIGRGLCAIRATGAHPRYLWWWAHSQIERLNSVATGSTYTAVTAEDVANLPVMLPPLEEQRRIADFLDTETTRLTEVATAMATQQELAEERLECLALGSTYGEVPGSLVPLRRFAASVKTGSTPSGTGPDFTADVGVGWLTPGSILEHLEVGEPARVLDRRAISDGVVPEFSSDSVVVVGIGATAGRVAHLRAPATGNQQLTAIATIPALSPRFLAWQLWSRTRQIRELAPYTTLPILSNDYLRSLEIRVPNRRRQDVAVEVLDAAAAASRELQTSLERVRALLAERRQALITAAVTGQLDVTTAHGGAA